VRPNLWCHRAGVVFEAEIRVKSVHDQIVIENQKREKIWKLKMFYINLYLIMAHEWNSQLAKST